MGRQGEAAAAGLSAADGRKPSVMRFSTADYAPRERLAAWREVYGRTMCRQEIEPVDTDAVQADVVFRVLPGLNMMTGYRSPAVHRRDPGQCGTDDLFITVALSGGFEASQLGRSTQIRPGEALVGTGAEPIVARVFPGSRSITLSVPLRMISPVVAGLDAKFGTHIPAGNPALDLMTRYAGIIEEVETIASPDLQQRAVTHVHDLLALALGATRDSREIAKLRGARAAWMREIKADIARNIGSEALSIGALAARHRLPVRYVQRLFEAEGASFTGFVLEQRLARAYRLLGDPRFAAQPIGIIAFEAGFTNQPYFNRAFRQRFGASPSDVRARARGDG